MGYEKGSVFKCLIMSILVTVSILFKKEGRKAQTIDPDVVQDGPSFYFFNNLLLTKCKI